jgi:hypothetical protein
MPYYYFDIETTGIYPKKNKIITIQFAKLHINVNYDECKILADDLKILKVWEFNSEKQLLEKFLEDSKFFKFKDRQHFNFIPVGNNLIFDIIFLYERAVHHRLINKEYLPLSKALRKKPFLDLKPSLVMLNNFKFTNYGEIIDKCMKSGSKSEDVPNFYRNKRFDEIDKYVKDEFNATLKVFTRICNMLDISYV